LFAHRPEPARLTTFYLAMSFGGVVGGAFCAVVAPLVFDWAYEHPLLILAAAGLVTTHPIFGFSSRLWERPGARPIIVGLLALLLSFFAVAATPALAAPWDSIVKIVLVVAIVDIAIIALGNRTAFVASLAALMLALGGWTMVDMSVDGGHHVRSYFGIYGLSSNPGPVRVLVHGTTVHGFQDLRPGRERDPLSYYAPESGVGLALRDLPVRKPRAHVGIVGLGSGTLSCYTAPGQDWRFYEIDPTVEKIARNPTDFSFLARCNPTAAVVIGDARLTLAHDSDPLLDALVIDAFSSDAVPMHLLTREAFAVYGRRLAPDGILIVHISNRFLKLEPVVAAAQRWGWHASARDFDPSKADGDHAYSPSHWIALSRDPTALDGMIARTGAGKWRPVRQNAHFDGWTDDYASILPLIKWAR
jgi:SAM-dependent methyltransferase